MSNEADSAIREVKAGLKELEEEYLEARRRQGECPVDSDEYKYQSKIIQDVCSQIISLRDFIEKLRRS